MQWTYSLPNLVENERWAMKPKFELLTPWLLFGTLEYVIRQLVFTQMLSDSKIGWEKAESGVYVRNNYLVTSKTRFYKLPAARFCQNNLKIKKMKFQKLK